MKIFKFIALAYAILTGTQSAVFAQGTEPFVPFRNAEAEVGVTCEIRYSTVKSTEHFVIELPLTPTAGHGGTSHVFDQVLTLDRLGRPDLLVWIDGSYVQLQDGDLPYMRMSVHLCEKARSPNSVKCLSNDYSGDLFGHRIARKGHRFDGKNLIMHAAYLNAKPADEGMDEFVEYRLKTGRKMPWDPAHADKYASLIYPDAIVTCSARDREFGIDSAF